MPKVWTLLFIVMRLSFCWNKFVLDLSKHEEGVIFSSWCLERNREKMFALLQGSDRDLYAIDD